MFVVLGVIFWQLLLDGIQHPLHHFSGFISCTRRFHPERMQVNSRGRAAFRAAHGKLEPGDQTLKGLNDQRPLQGHVRLRLYRGLRAKPLAHGYSSSSFQDAQTNSSPGVLNWKV